MTQLEADYSRTCFVAMPYGERKVGKQIVDFDAIYQEIFRKAIRRVRNNNGVMLIPKRADDASHSRLLVHAMIQDLIQSRLLLADVSADNTNVGAEIATRYALVPSGTVLVRLKGTSAPFDFAAVQITEYSNKPPDVIPIARARIATALRETLKHNEIDNPFYEQAQMLASRMGKPENPTKLGDLLVDAELAARRKDLATAIDKYAEAERIEPEFAALHRRRATLLLEGGFLEEAARETRKALKISPEFLEGRRWLEEIKRGKLPKPFYLDPESWRAINVITASDSALTRKPKIIITPHQRQDGVFEAELMIDAKLPKQGAQILKDLSSFGRVKVHGRVMMPIRKQEFNMFSITGKKSSHVDLDQMLAEIVKRSGFEARKVRPAGSARGGRFKGRGRFGGGFGGDLGGGFSGR